MNYQAILEMISSNWFEAISFLFGAISCYIAITERSARINLEKERKKEVEEHQYVYDLIAKGLEQQKLDKDIGKLKQEKSSLENQQKALNEYINEEIPKLAKNSFGKYCAEMYESQLIENYYKYESFKKYLSDDENPRVPDSLVPEITEIINKDKKSGISFETVYKLILGIFAYTISSKVGLPGLRHFSIIFFVDPIIDILGCFDKRIESCKNTLASIGNKLVTLIMLFIISIYLIFFNFYMASSFGIVVKNTVLFKVILLTLLLILLAMEISLYKGAKQEIMKLVSIKVSRYSTIIGYVIGAGLLVISLIMMCFTNERFFLYDVLFSFEYNYYDLIRGNPPKGLLIITFITINESLIVLLGELCVQHSIKKSQ